MARRPSAFPRGGFRSWSGLWGRGWRSLPPKGSAGTTVSDGPSTASDLACRAVIQTLASQSGEAAGGGTSSVGDALPGMRQRRPSWTQGRRRRRRGGSASSRPRATPTTAGCQHMTTDGTTRARWSSYFARWRPSSVPPQRSWALEVAEALAGTAETPPAGVMGVPPAGGSDRSRTWSRHDGVVAHSEAAPIMSTIRRAEIARCRFCGRALVLPTDDLRPRWLHAADDAIACPRRAAPQYS